MQAGLSLPTKAVFSGLTIGRVYNVYPEANMVDIMLFGGSILTRVQVLTSFASSRSGSFGLPLPSYKESVMVDRKKPLEDARQDESDVFAVVGFLGGSSSRPIVLGFLFPENCEMLCSRDQVGNKDGTQFLWKHESNVYIRVAKEEPGQRQSSEGETISERTPVTPDIEVSHPSGLLIKIGSYDAAKGPDEQRTPIDNYDKKIRPFKFKNPETDAVSPTPVVHLYHPSGTYLTIDAVGKVTVYVVGDMDKTVKGDLTELIEGNVDRTIKGNLTEIVEGDGTDTIKGTWLRQSNTKIEDKAPQIHHNE